jgi:hypothetical protein
MWSCFPDRAEDFAGRLERECARHIIEITYDSPFASGPKWKNSRQVPVDPGILPQPAARASGVRQLAALDELVETRPKAETVAAAGRSAALDQRRPVLDPAAGAGNEMHFDAPRPLLEAAVDLAARETDARHRRRLEVATEQVRTRL